MATGPSNLNRLTYFVAVVETGSFTAAADRLGITRAVVSQQVARLERDCHATLLTRSTRRVRTTEAGQAFYYRCALILKEAEDAFDELAESAQTPSGTLRLTAPFDYGVGVIVPAITAFSERFPQCQVEAQFGDQTMNLEDSDLDLAIRVGWLTDDHLQARLIGHFEQRLVAAPSWQERLADVETPQALIDHPIIANTALRDPTRWTFHRDELVKERVTLTASIKLNATLAVREATLNGAGLAVLPDYVVDADVSAGRLIDVLPQWHLPRGDIHAVLPPARYRPAKVRAFIDMLIR
ncbi:LysR family transcriptional regulator [Larsenimonas suaedae]|uniref:LysR family transcriptional regulator n=1 Tax=Larsenimonas suaedae TaxID=1851019 RepID=A0ABU1GR40_9GAMM|nr:LysR family transcriptional regulator [Larsenimonas suaedae]MCM2972700.1 LysR family transcriptional regulator [Larsenimonas suaedae]MDR5894503.1 LysR family transcriptional regulator [Larsenimonas suaedae]